MIGLIKLKAPNGDPIFVNPAMISWFAPNNEALCKNVGINPAYSNGQGTCITVAGTPFQVQENTNEIINAITRLRTKAEQNALKLRDKAMREDWQGPEEDEDDNTDD